MAERMSEEEFRKLMAEVSLSTVPPGTFQIVAIPMLFFLSATLAFFTSSLLIRLPAPMMFAGAVLLVPSLPFFLGKRWPQTFYRIAGNVEVVVLALLAAAAVLQRTYWEISPAILGIALAILGLRLLRSPRVARAFMIRAVLRERWSRSGGSGRVV